MYLWNIFSRKFIIQEKAKKENKLVWNFRYMRKVGPETRDLSYVWDPIPGTQLIGGTQDMRPGTLNVGLETRDTDFTWDLRSETQDTERGIWNTCDRWDARLKTNISCGTWNARTVIQMNLFKCPINRILVIILLIFNHIKRLQHL